MLKLLGARTRAKEVRGSRLELLDQDPTEKSTSGHRFVRNTREPSGSRLHSSGFDIRSQKGRRMTKKCKLVPAMGFAARASTDHGFARGAHADTSAPLQMSGIKKGSWFLLLAVFAALRAYPVATATSPFQPYTLRVKTCNATEAGTVGQLLLSFCVGYNSCLMGPTNEYNSKAELNVVGAWTTLEVPLEYEPTTMSMAIVGDDAWCVEEMVWEDRRNILGTGGRIYLDGNLGEGGCQYGVHTNTGWYYPCQSNWRFFDLPRSDDYRYEIKVKPCASSTSTTDHSALASSPSIASSVCSESQCDPTVGEVIDFNLTAAAAKGGSSSGWVTTSIPAGFNPVAMKLTNIGEFPWCAEAITFNDYTLIDESHSPRGMKLGVGDDRRFFNVQFLGTAAASSIDSFDGNQDDGLEDKAWGLAGEVISAVLVFTATVAVTAFVRRCVKRHEEDEGRSEYDVNGEALDTPLVEMSRYEDPPADPPSGTRPETRAQASLAATASAAGETASRENGGDEGAIGHGGDTESDVFCCRNQQEPSRPSCDGDGHVQNDRDFSSSSSSGGTPSIGANSAETVVGAYRNYFQPI